MAAKRHFRVKPFHVVMQGIAKLKTAPPQGACSVIERRPLSSATSPTNTARHGQVRAWQRDRPPYLAIPE